MKYRIVKVTLATGAVRFLVQDKPTAWWSFLARWRTAASFPDLDQARFCVISLRADDAAQRELDGARKEVVR